MYIHIYIYTLYIFIYVCDAETTHTLGCFLSLSWLYKTIIHSAGAGGCPLAQTMAENGLSVLLLERGGEQVYNSQQIMTSIKALTDDCAESIRSTQGHTVTTGNCMGGTSLHVWKMKYMILNRYT
jgi:choline dehydrogenase-like flavoprotein